MKTGKKNILAIAMAAIMVASLVAVFSASAQTPTVSIAGAPAACAKDATTLDLFVRGSDNALYQKTLTGTTWSSGVSLGGVLTSDPSAVATGSGGMNVYVRGTNGAPYMKTWSGTAWGDWVKLSGLILPGTGPAAYSGGLFVTGMNSALYQGQLSGGIVTWTKLDGVCTSSPAAVKRADGAIDVFVRGTDGALYEREYTAAVWGAWTNWGGVIYPGTAPAAASFSPNRVDVFVKGMNSALYQRWAANGVASDWVSLSGYLTSSPGATAPAAGGYMNVFVRGGNNGLWTRAYTATPPAWTDWTSIGGM